MATVCIGQDCCKSWEKSGKAQVLKLFKELGEENNGLATASKTSDRLLYELASHVLKGNLKTNQAVNVLEEFVEFSPSVRQDFAAVLSILDAETKSNEDYDGEDESEPRKSFISLLKECKTLITLPVYKEQLDPKTLDKVGYMTAQQFNQKYIKTKTKLFYKQQKFNLLREESEGYAKLITELSREPSSSLTVSDTLYNVKSLIGCFNLDPNRVLDIILELFECRIHLADDLFVPLLTEYIPEYATICQILGFRLQMIKGKQPANLFGVIAILMKHDLVTLDTIYPHLSPSDEVIQETYKRTLQDARTSVKKGRAVHTGDKKDEKTTPNNTKLSNDDQAESNQKLLLIEALLTQGAWEQAKSMMDRLPQYHAASYPGVAKVICSLLHAIIDPLYEKHNGLPNVLIQKRQKHTTRYLQTVDQWCHLPDVAFPMLRYLGCHLSCDSVLLVKVVRLLKAFVILKNSGEYQEADADLIYRNVLSILDEVILPSLCLSDSNCCMSEQVWSVLQLLPYELRYQLYGQWKSQTYYMQPELIAARLDTVKKAKYIFSRLTKENVKQQGRSIGKITHANPTVFFEYMFTQVQVYDNLIGPIVDALKYLTAMSYDVLAYCLIEALAAPDKERMKYDDTSLSNWLKSLANFTGSVLKKYQVEFSGLLQYICNQLKAEKSFDLLILREIVTKMGGIEVSEEITDQQLEAMCGGELLKQEGGNFVQTRNVKRPSQRLKETLLKHNLAGPLCLLMAQQRDCIVYKETVSMEHIKLVGKVYDQCQDTLVQFVNFLSSQLTMDEYAKKLPSLHALISEYHIPSDAAFYILRPMIAHEINMKFDSLKRQDKQIKDKANGTPDKSQRYIEAVSSVLVRVSETIQPLYDAKMWEDMSSLLYTTFWALHVYDLHLPKAAYDREINNIKQKIQQIQIDSDRRDRDMSASKRKKEIDRFQQVISKLKEEEKKQTEHCARVLARLNHDKDRWFKSYDSQKNSKGKGEAVGQFIQFCVFPRLLNTTVDAIYCAEMILTMHRIKTPNFGMLICLDRLFNDWTYQMTACTENEAHRYGRFMAGILEFVTRWHKSEKVFKEECSGHPGFITTFRAGTLGTNHAEMNYEDFRHLCHKWQFRITKSCIACFESSNYTQIRNAFIVLTKILPYYPMILGIGQALERRVDRVHKEEKEKRPDLYALALGYGGLLKSKKSRLMPEHEFHKVDKEKQERARARLAAAAQANKAKSATDEKPADTKPAKTATATKSVSKERLEAAAYLKAEETRTSGSSPDIVEVKVKQETGSASTNKAASGKINSSPVVNGKVKEERKERSRDSDVSLSKSANLSPHHPADDRDVKRRKVDLLTVDSKKGASGSGADAKRISLSKSPARIEDKTDRKVDKEAKKRASDQSASREDVKKRRSDVRVAEESKSDRHRNGDGDLSARGSRSPKRDKERKEKRSRKE